MDNSEENQFYQELASREGEDEIDFLVSQTLKLSEKLALLAKNTKDLRERSTISPFDVAIGFSLSVSTYTVQIIDGEPSASSIRVPLTSIDEKKLLTTTFMKGRYPLFEDQLCNLSDPGNSWWLHESSEGMEIFFQFRYEFQSGKGIRLGPLGNPQEMIQMVNQNYQSIINLIPVKEMSATPRSFKLVPKDCNNEYFQQWIDFFRFARECFYTQITPFDQLMRQIYLNRKAWILVHQRVNSELKLRQNH